MIRILAFPIAVLALALASMMAVVGAIIEEASAMCDRWRSE
jgi:hypothetical protein